MIREGGCELLTSDRQHLMRKHTHLFIYLFMSLKINVNYNIQTILVSESLQQNKPQNSDCVFRKHNLYIMYKKKNSTQKCTKCSKQISSIVQFLSRHMYTSCCEPAVKGIYLCSAPEVTF